MEFRIADTFTDSLARLTGEEQKATKTTAFDLQINPANPGHQFHKLDRARDKNFWSVRVGADIRIIVHRSPEGILLCYAAHHDKAYDWAERRKIEAHPKTGAAQIARLNESLRSALANPEIKQRLLEFGADAVAGHVDHVVHPAGDPVIAVLVAAAAVAGEVLAGIGGEIGLEEALMVAPDGAHHPGPCVGDAQIALGRAVQHLALGIDDLWAHAR